MKLQKTFTPTPADVDRVWWVMDAEDVPLGRLASEAAKLLRGKHKPTYSPHFDLGDFVIVVNAAHVGVTGTKEQDKIYYRHSGYPGGLRAATLGQLRVSNPERIVEQAVRGMLPKNRLGRRLFTHLKIYAGPEHPHFSQKPQPFALEKKAQ